MEKEKWVACDVRVRENKINGGNQTKQTNPKQKGKKRKSERLPRATENEHGEERKKRKTTIYRDDRVRRQGRSREGVAVAKGRRQGSPPDPVGRAGEGGRKGWCPGRRLGPSPWLGFGTGGERCGVCEVGMGWES